MEGEQTVGDMFWAERWKDIFPEEWRVPSLHYYLDQASVDFLTDDNTDPLLE